MPQSPITPKSTRSISDVLFHQSPNISSPVHSQPSPAHSGPSAVASFSSHIERIFLHLRAEELATAKNIREANLVELETRRRQSEMKRKSWDAKETRAQRDLDNALTRRAELRARIDAGLTKGAKATQKKREEIEATIVRLREELAEFEQRKARVMMVETEIALDVNSTQEEIMRVEKDMEVLNKMVSRRKGPTGESTKQEKEKSHKQEERKGRGGREKRGDVESKESEASE